MHLSGYIYPSVHRYPYPDRSLSITCGYVDTFGCIGIYVDVYICISISLCMRIYMGMDKDLSIWIDMDLSEYIDVSIYL